MNSKDKGRKLENYVAETFKKIDKKARPTRGSGAGIETADILNKFFYVECKKRNTKDITIKKAVWDKLCSEIPMGSAKIPLYILENAASDRYIVMDIKDFERMINKLYGQTKGK